MKEDSAHSQKLNIKNIKHDYEYTLLKKMTPLATLFAIFNGFSMAVIGVRRFKAL